jgi:hypothetical protein
MNAFASGIGNSDARSAKMANRNECRYRWLRLPVTTDAAIPTAMVAGFAFPKFCEARAVVGKSFREMANDAHEIIPQLSSLD